MGKWEKQETHSAHTVFVFADNVARIPHSAFGIGYAVHVVRFRNPKPQNESPIPHLRDTPCPIHSISRFCGLGAAFGRC